MKRLLVLLLILIGLLQYRLWFGDGNVREFRRLNDKIEELRQEGDRRRERNAAMEAEVMDLKQGLDAIEERARQDLGMIKEGETFVQVFDRQPEKVVKPAVKPPVEDELKTHKPERGERRHRRVRPAEPVPTPAPAPEPESTVEPPAPSDE